MNAEEMGILLGGLCEHYGQPEFSDEMFDYWWNSFQMEPNARMEYAAERAKISEVSFPKVAQFRRYLEPLRVGPSVCRCGGSGWVEGSRERGVRFPSTNYETVLPCPTCNERAVLRKREAWDKEPSHRAIAAEQDLLPSNPRKGLAQARAARAEAEARREEEAKRKKLATATKNADDL